MAGDAAYALIGVLGGHTEGSGTPGRACQLPLRHRKSDQKPRLGVIVVRQRMRESRQNACADSRAQSRFTQKHGSMPPQQWQWRLKST